MTQQIPDLFNYKDQHLRVSDIEGSGLHVASDFKIKTRSATTACWRGFVMQYVITDNQLMLDNIWFKPETQELPKINGIEPIPITREAEPTWAFFFSHAYKNLNKKVSFNGSLEIRKYITESQFIEMGFMSPNVHRTALKLDFKDGMIVDAEDISQQGEWEKGEPTGIKPKSMDPEDVDEWVRERFALEPRSDPSAPKVPPEPRKSTKEKMLDELDRLKKL